MSENHRPESSAREEKRSGEVRKKLRPRPESLDAAFWESRYQQEDTGWDVGYATTPITEWFETFEDRGLSKSSRILIPGAGRAYEAEYLHRKGFSQVYVLDWSRTALDALKSRAPDFPDANLFQGDFFRHEGSYDVLVEQTFFCAIDPGLRSQWASHSASLLNSGGRHVGLFFNFPFDPEFGPPFGGTEADYREILNRHLQLESLELASNSIKPRLGSEFFFVARKA